MGYSGTILFPGHQTGTRNRWEDNITIYLREIWWEDMDWMHLAQDRDQWGTLVKTVKNLLVP